MKILNYIKGLIESTTKSSSKRFLAIGTFLLMAATHVPVWVNGTPTDNIILIGVDVTTICTLLGIATAQNNLKSKLDASKNTNNAEEAVSDEDIN
jgi:hypothetical protein